MIGDFNHGANPGFVLLIDGHVFELLAAVFDFAEVGVQPDVQLYVVGHLPSGLIEPVDRVTESLTSGDDRVHTDASTGVDQH